MKEKIDETLKRIAGATSKASSPTTSNIDGGRGGRGPGEYNDLPGDPNCPYCGGIGYLRSDVPVGHPDFGKLQICSCRSSQVSEQIHRRLFAMSNLDELRHLSFENFQPRGRFGLNPVQADSLERAYNHAHQFAQSLRGWLLLEGTYGCGKTHLAAAVANFAVEMGVPTLFLTVPDLLDTLRFAFGDPQETFEQRFGSIREASLLVLDDFGTQNTTHWAQEKLFQIFNYRYINHLPLVVTTNISLDEIEERIQSRLRDPELVTRVRILAPDYRNPTQEAQHSELSSLANMQNMTFANFDLRKSEGLSEQDTRSLEKAFQAAQVFAKDPQGWLVFTGEYGCGKTHLAAAIAKFAVDMGIPTQFTTVPDLLDHLRATFNPASTTSLDRRFEQIRTERLLILDDLGTQSSTPWAREKLYQLFNYRYQAELPTVITTSDTLDEMDQRLRSRMLDVRLCTIYAITVPSYRGLPRKPTGAGVRNKKRR